VEVAVHANDSHTYLIPSTIIATGKDHFCTARGQGDTVLEATVNPAPAPADISWIGTGAFAFTVPGVGADRLTAKISSNTVSGQDIPFTITIAGDICYSGRYWTIWTAAPVVNLGAPPYFAFDNTSIIFSGPISFTYAIQPASIISATPATVDIPDLRGPNNDLGGTPVPPPRVPAADVNVQNSGANTLDGGAANKWDVSRQNKQKPINLANIPDTIASMNAQGFGDLMVLYTNFPSDPLAGNDDKGVGDEDDDPYTAGLAGVGNIQSGDAPGRQILHSDGDVGDTFELRLHFREFARVLLDDKWYPISGFSLWKIHMRAKKKDEAADNTDYDKDGKKDKKMWADDGTVLEQNNNGF
jgi:hypothetical protein